LPFFISQFLKAINHESGIVCKIFFQKKCVPPGLRDTHESRARARMQQLSRKSQEKTDYAKAVPMRIS
jgi:hypothetical protein